MLPSSLPILSPPTAIPPASPLKLLPVLFHLPPPSHLQSLPSAEAPFPSFVTSHRHLTRLLSPPPKLPSYISSLIFLPPSHLPPLASITVPSSSSLISSLPFYLTPLPSTKASPLSSFIFLPKFHMHPLPSTKAPSLSFLISSPPSHSPSFLSSKVSSPSSLISLSPSHLPPLVSTAVPFHHLLLSYCHLTRLLSLPPKPASDLLFVSNYDHTYLLSPPLHPPPYSLLTPYRQPTHLFSHPPLPFICPPPYGHLVLFAVAATFPSLLHSLPLQFHDANSDH